MDNATFKRAAADINGTSLRGYLDGVTASAMIATFGKYDPDGYVDDEKGYDGMEWQFEASDARVFNVYARYGSFRIGAHGECEDFKAWLLAQIAGGQS